MLAQTKQSITGEVVEFETGEPMQYANVVLSKDIDSTLVAGTVTDLDGKFHFKNINEGKYYITVSFIGFEKHQTPVFRHKTNTKINKLAIKKTSILLDEVNIAGEKSTLVTTLDKKIYNVGKDIISESGSVSDILQNIPSVSVDVNGNVTLRGTSNITFLINGNPSSRLRRNAPLALQQIPAYTIERIEVITNPSAKYSPEGIGGIINLVQRKDSEKGMNGQIIGNIGNEKRYNTNLILNYGQEDFSTFLSYSLRHPSGAIVYSDERIKKDLTTGQKLSFYNENGSTTTKPLAHVFDAGMIYQLDPQSSFEFSGNYFLQNSFHQGFSDINEFDVQNQPLTSLHSENTNDELESEGEGGASFEHIFDGNVDHNLVIEAEYASYYEREDLNFEEYYTIPEVENISQQIFVKKSGNQIDLISEYALPVDGDTEFEAGYSGEFINDDIFYINNQLAGTFLFDQNVHGIYALVSRDIENYNIELGLRAEQTFITSNLVEPKFSLTKNDYFKLYPSFRLSYELDESQNFNFSYSKRVNRPDADQLNPFPEFTDPRNAESGNPELRPEQIHSLELTYQKISESITFTPSLFYRYTYDSFTTVSNLYGDSTIITTIENLSNQKSAGLETILSAKVQKWWDFDLSGSLFYNEIDATNLGYSQNKSTTSGMVELYSLFKITRKTFLQLNLSYESPVLTPQGQKEAIFYVNIGLKQLLFYDQISLTFTVSDLFGTYKERMTVNTPDLNQETKLYRKEPVFYLGISWRFGESYQSDENELEFESEGLRKL